MYCRFNKRGLKIFFLPVLRIRIRRIHMFLGLSDPDPLVRASESGAGSGSFYHQAKIVPKKNIDSYCIVM